MIHHNHSKKANELLDGYVDHRIAVQRVAEKYKLPVEKVDNTITNFFAYAVRRFIINCWPMDLKNFMRIDFKHSRKRLYYSKIIRGREYASKLMRRYDEKKRNKKLLEITNKEIPLHDKND